MAVPAACAAGAGKRYEGVERLAAIEPIVTDYRYRLTMDYDENKIRLE